jgi:uncharacterized protein YigE (DUF2233 family)
MHGALHEACTAVGHIEGMTFLLSLLVPSSSTPNPPDPVTSSAVEARTVEYLGAAYRVATVDLRGAELSLVGQGEGEPHSFAALAEDVEVIAATNAGLFHSVDVPVGLWMQGGVEHQPLELGDGLGNFFLKPNGVFWLDGEGAHVAPSEGWSSPATAWVATQSGPLLVSEGALHPSLKPDGTSRKTRNAVGVLDPWTVVLVASEAPVRFHDLATLMRDRLGAADALFLDGTISGLAGPGLAPVEDRRDVAGFLVVTERPVATGLRDGDVVLQRSTSSQAAAIAQATGSEWTHTGLVRLVGGEPHVLEAVQPVKLTPYAEWVARGIGGRVRVRRHVMAEAIWTEERLAALDALQATWLGRNYDLRFEPGDDALYCSELVREAYLQAAGVEVAPLRPVSSYHVDDPGLRAAMAQRWGQVPEAMLVVAPSDLAAAEGWVEVRP